MTIRKLELEEMHAAAAVHRASLLHAIPVFADLHTAEEDRHYFREHVFPACEVWGAFDDQTLVGIIAFRRDWIDQLYVLPGAQHQGIGTALLEIVRKKYSSLHAWTFQRNAGARRFYESRKFVSIKETDGSENAEKEPDVLYFWSRES
jgi:putative acetyltransferase